MRRTTRRAAAGDTRADGHDGPHPDGGRAALDDLRGARRRKRIEGIDWFDAAYHAYLAGLVGIVVTLFVSSWVGDADLSAEALADLRDHGPAWIGLLAAVAVAVGLRSGSRGGPVAVQEADIRHVLLAPVDRGAALRPTAWRQLRFALFAGTVVGMIAGQLAVRRLPGHAVEWVAAGGVTGAAIGALFVGTAMVASGRRCPRWVATLGAAAAVAWAAADALRGVDVPGVWSPFRLVGGLALWPVEIHWWDLLAIAVVVVLVVVGLLGIGGVRLEDAERRTALVGQLRFAVTLQDLRTVMVLRRQLAQDRPRHRPWFRLPGRRLPVWRRSVHGLLRFPATRLVRLALFGAAAGIALRAAWYGTTPLVGVAAVLLYLAALDAAEPLAQEVDQSDRTDAYPVDRGELYLRFLPATVVAMTLVGLVGAAVVVLWEGTAPAAALTAVVGVPAVLCATAGGVTSVMLGVPQPYDDKGIFVPPEVAGIRIALRSAWPVMLSVLGTMPLVAAIRADRPGASGLILESALNISSLCVLPAFLTFAWVRYRDRLRQGWQQVLEEGNQANRERMAAKSPTDRPKKAGAPPA